MSNFPLRGRANGVVVDVVAGDASITVTRSGNRFSLTGAGSASDEWNEVLANGASTGTTVNTSGTNPQISGGDFIEIFDPLTANQVRVEIGPAAQDLDGDVCLFQARNRSDGIEGVLRWRCAPSTVHVDWAFAGIGLFSHTPLSNPDPIPEVDVDLICGDSASSSDHFLNLLSGNTETVGIKFGDINDANIGEIDYVNGAGAGTNEFRIRNITATSDFTTVYDQNGDWFLPIRISLAGAAFSLAAAGRDTLVIGDQSGTVGITLLPDTAGTASLTVAEGADTIEQAIEFDLGNDMMDFRVADSIRMTIEANLVRPNNAQAPTDLGNSVDPWRNVFQQSQNVGTQTTGAGGVTLGAADYLLTVTGAAAITLPPSAAAVEGRVYAVDNQQLAATTTVTPDGADTINGAASVTIGSSAVSFFILLGTRWSSWESPHTT